jgi:hypothetical protein
MKRLAIISLFALAVPAAAPADSVTDIAAILRADSPIPFRYGVAGDLAENILDAQLLATYAGPMSLELSIESVVRAIGIDNTLYVGWASMDPITWLQSGIAIDPNASIGITPSALYFGEAAVVSTPEPDVWILVAVALIIGLACGWLWLRRVPKPSAPVIMTDYGPVTEWARRQAEVNMLADPEIKRQVEQQLAEKYGSLELGKQISRERFPGAYTEK